MPLLYGAAILLVALHKDVLELVEHQPTLNILKVRLVRREIKERILANVWLVPQLSVVQRLEQGVLSDLVALTLSIVSSV